MVSSNETMANNCDYSINEGLTLTVNTSDLTDDGFITFKSSTVYPIKSTDDGIFDQSAKLRALYENEAASLAGMFRGPDRENSFDDLDLDSPRIRYKYAENRIIDEFKDYIDKTYGEHYKTDDEEPLEPIDAWLALGSATTTCRDTAIKYLWRYGKKDGNNKKDLMKALHYILLAIYSDHHR